eukprot:TRINITY_DN22095_c0_g1_i1.p1 TRINITY_DN22095_c0_g1~~TRINITY_DN22095_c0_g1_i1.p1  ORF type:complete len:290 (+),score=63.21 TRINITY_DN22095_c0_g1_i1:68-937(+)
MPLIANGVRIGRRRGSDGVVPTVRPPRAPAALMRRRVRRRTVRAAVAPRQPSLDTPSVATPSTPSTPSARSSPATVPTALWLRSVGRLVRLPTPRVSTPPSPVRSAVPPPQPSDAPPPPPQPRPPPRSRVKVTMTGDEEYDWALRLLRPPPGLPPRRPAARRRAVLAAAEGHRAATAGACAAGAVTEGPPKMAFLRRSPLTAKPAVQGNKHWGRATEIAAVLSWAGDEDDGMPLPPQASEPCWRWQCSKCGSVEKVQVPSPARAASDRSFERSTRTNMRLDHLGRPCAV